MSSVQLQRPVEETTHHQENPQVSHDQSLEQKTPPPPPPPPPAQALGSTQPTTKTLGHDQVVLPKSSSPCCGGQANYGHQTQERASHKVSSHGLAEVHSVGQQAHSKSDKKKESKSEDKKKNKEKKESKSEDKNKNKEKKESKSEDKKKNKEKKSEHTKKNKKNGKKSSKYDASSSSDSD